MKTMEISTARVQQFVKDHNPCRAGVCDDPACAFARELRMMLKIAPKRKAVKRGR